MRFEQAVAERGFESVAGVLSAAECARLADVLASPAVTRSRAGARHLLALEPLSALASDRRLVSLAAAVLGSGAVPFRATFFNKGAGANWAVAWHQDTALPLRRRFEAAGWGPWSTKAGVLYAHAPAEALKRVCALRVHLDDSSVANGPLRVIPGSHRRGVLTDDEVSVFAHEHDFVECVVSAGGVLVMSPLLIHASSKSSRASEPRRVLHIEYASSLQLGADIELAAA